jgi:hypothetical protein
LFLVLGPTHAAIVIGMTVPLTGPNSAYGAGLRDGATLAVECANAVVGLPAVGFSCSRSTMPVTRNALRPTHVI